MCERKDEEREKIGMKAENLRKQRNHERAKKTAFAGRERRKKCGKRNSSGKAQRSMEKEDGSSIYPPPPPPPPTIAPEVISMQERATIARK